MGLDMMALKTKNDIADIDFELEEGQAEELFYWRKHPNLHGWMESLYRQKGGTQEFNCVPVRLTPEDIDALEKAVNNNGLPNTSGFFFGQSDETDKPRDLEFIQKARDAFEEGYNVFYDSWW